MTVVIVVALLEIAAAALLVRAALRVRAAAAALPRHTGPRPEVDDRIDERRTSSAHPLLAVEILNAPELAARESWAARRIGTLLPRVVGREVAAQAADRMAEQLAEQGVRAEVRIVAPRQP